MCKKFEGIDFGPNILGQQLLKLFRELSDFFLQILLTKRRYIYSLVRLLRLIDVFYSWIVIHSRDG